MATDRIVEIEVHDFHGNSKWVCAYPRKESQAELNILIRKVGRWAEANESDVEGTPRMPAWVREAEERIAQLGHNLDKFQLAGRTPISLRIIDPESGLRVIASIHNEFTEHGDALGEDPIGRLFSFEVQDKDFKTISNDGKMHRAKEICAAAKDWEGSGEIQEKVYDLSAHAINVARERIQSMRRSSTGELIPAHDSTQEHRAENPTLR